MDNVTTENKKAVKKNILILIAVAAVLLICVAVVIIVNSQSTSKRLAKQLDLGQKYMEEMDYEQAIVAFNKAIEIDPMSADAYIGLVEVYIRTTDFETALEYAKKGYEATGDERLKEKIDMIESGNIFAENGWQMKTSYYKSENELSYYVTFNYNLKGKVATATAYAPDNSIIDKVDYEYDEDGKMTWGVGAYASEFYGDSSPLYRVENKFDDNGQIIGRNEYNDKGNLTSSSEYEYRDDGHVIRTVHRQNGDYEVIEENSDYQIILDEYYDENGNLTNYSTYEYDSNGNLANQRFYSADGTLYSYVESEYDENGKKIKSTSYKANGEIEHTTVFE